MLEAKIEINHPQILKNLNAIKSRIEDNVKIMAVVKSNAYGHGIIEVSKTLENHVDMLAVGFLEEGILLRAHVKKDIFIMGPCYDYDVVIANNFVITLESIYQFNALIHFYDINMKGTDKRIRLHLKVDTGMHRFGMTLDEVKDIMNTIDNKNCENNLIIEGVFSHFAATPKHHKKRVEKQYQQFVKVKEYVKNHYKKPVIFHIANSENAVESLRFNEDMVRLGNGLYGPMSLENPLYTETVAKLLFPIMSIHTVKEKSRFGYGFKSTAKKGMRLGAVKTGFYEGTGMSKMPIGVNIFSIFIQYQKSFLKAVLKKEYVHYGTVRLPIVGMINMQFFQVDLTKTNIMVGDFVEYKKAPLYYKESVKRVHILEERHETYN